MVRVRGARAHNLKDVDVELPAGKLVVCIGPSGSGKSSLLFDVIHREATRRFVEAQGGPLAWLMGGTGATDVDEIEGLPPTLALRASATPAGARSTVSTLSGAAPLLRRLFAAFGEAVCPECGSPLRAWSPGEAADEMLAAGGGKRAALLADARRFGLPEEGWLEQARAAGVSRMRWGGEEFDLERWIAPRPLPEGARVVVDRVRLSEDRRARLVDSAESAYRLGRGVFFAEIEEGPELRFCAEAKCPEHGTGFAGLRQSVFNFNHPDGACPDCGGSGSASEDVPCPRCGGSGVDPKCDCVRVGGKSWRELDAMTAGEAEEWLRALPASGLRTGRIWEALSATIAERFALLRELGLSHLALGRRGNALSGGETLRVRLAAQLGAKLGGMLVLAEEPLAGLHARDAAAVWNQLLRLRDAGNTVFAAEHSARAARDADWVVELGPGGGARGGELLFAGTPSELLACERSVTAPWLRDPPAVARAGAAPELGSVVLRGATGRNLKNVDLEVPLGRLVCVSGVSGSGKSSLVAGTFAAALLRAKGQEARPLPFASLEGAERVGFVRLLRQGELAAAPRSVVATALGVWDDLRSLLAQSPEAKLRGWGPGRFSFNVKGGRCERCQGLGRLQLDPEALPDLWGECPDCRGDRFGAETLEARVKGMHAGELLKLDAEAALRLFRNIPAVARPLEALCETGLGYVSLGQPAGTLSAGEAQRLRLAALLGKGGTAGKVRNALPGIYVLDEPARGLHFAEVEKLIRLFRKLTEAGNAVLVVEHREEMLAAADVKIEMGPGGGPSGGRILSVEKA